MSRQRAIRKRAYESLRGAVQVAKALPQRILRTSVKLGRPFPRFQKTSVKLGRPFTGVGQGIPLGAGVKAIII